MPVLGDDAFFASVAVECAAEQGAFWPFHDRFMADDDTLFTEPGLKRQASHEGIDAAQLWSCAANGETSPSVSASRAAGESRGVRATPTVFVNGEQVEPTWEAIAEAVESALESAP